MVHQAAQNLPYRFVMELHLRLVSVHQLASCVARD